MSTPQGAQALLARLLAEPALLADVRAAPEAFAARYGLSPADVRRLCAAGAPGLRMTGLVTRLKKFEVAEVALPATLTLCRAAWDDETIFGRCLVGARMTTLPGVIDAAVRLGELVTGTTPAADLPVVRDLLRYEVLLHEVRGRAREEHSGRAAAHPALGPGVTVETFDCPVTQVQRRVIDRVPFDDLRERRTHYVFAPGSGTRVLAHRIPAALRTLLAHCDGSRPVTTLGRTLGIPAESVRRALVNLRAKGVDITFGTC
ncbi:hypothetical protein Misp01_81370 [Microtetraspora sp. NBRC 13810]|uniref:hypothetical protein n=1 Tax=Microtetraspora sp. NBRC 13810 TaxID=3030990 RepID=UPI0024A2AC52|nr:hypothetical protein [Microtetraspora sp. NBRC 13810]GLW13009.1 hypothetical protein Misp01_81370 [Microtetraspora sp. NBRC 13810]